MRIAAAQTAPLWGDAAVTTEVVIDWIRRAADENVDLVAIGETFLSGHAFWTWLTDGARFNDVLPRETRDSTRTRSPLQRLDVQTPQRSTPLSAISLTVHSGGLATGPLRRREPGSADPRVGEHGDIRFVLFIVQGGDPNRQPQNAQDIDRKWRIYRHNPRPQARGVLIHNLDDEFGVVVVGAVMHSSQGRQPVVETLKDIRGLLMRR